MAEFVTIVCLGACRIIDYLSEDQLALFKSFLSHQLSHPKDCWIVTNNGDSYRMEAQTEGERTEAREEWRLSPFSWCYHTFCLKLNSCSVVSAIQSSVHCSTAVLMILNDINDTNLTYSSSRRWAFNKHSQNTIAEVWHLIITRHQIWWQMIHECSAKSVMAIPSKASSWGWPNSHMDCFSCSGSQFPPEKFLFLLLENLPFSEQCVCR